MDSSSSDSEESRDTEIFHDSFDEILLADEDIFTWHLDPKVNLSSLSIVEEDQYF